MTERLDEGPAALWGTIGIAPPRTAHRHTVWHYTDAAGLAGILTGNPARAEKPTGALWATAATVLNDPDEMKYGAAIVSEQFPAVSNHFDPTTSLGRLVREVAIGLEEWILENPAYVVCASQRGDMLGQWRGYAGRAGYSIELEAHHEYVVWPTHTPKRSLSWEPTWVRVRYHEEDQADLLRQCMETIIRPRSQAKLWLSAGSTDMVKEMIRALLAAAAAAMKNPAFEDEREVRLLAFKPRKVTPSFRGGERGLMPYVQVVPALNPNEIFPTRTAPMPVVSVTVGPPRGDLMDQRERAARILLDSTGRHEVPVHRSAIPFIP